jgi:hypothetical protein
MNILLAMEESGVVRDAFLARGHNAWSCDLLPSRGRAGNHLQGDVRWALDGALHKYPNVYDIRTGRSPIFIKWDMLIAFPDCTYLCSSGLHWNKRDPLRAAMTEDALTMVRLLMTCSIPKKAIENSIGCISTRIRKPDQIIQPYQFGDDASKATCLWLDGLAPLPIDPAKRVPGRLVNGRERWANQTDSGQNRLGPSPTRARDRATTYPGIAKAMACTWG